MAGNNGETSLQERWNLVVNEKEEHLLFSSLYRVVAHLETNKQTTY
jgi:hypothetical protein